MVARSRIGTRRRADAGTQDLAIALLDVWAAVGDLLTFYQERIANEAYLGAVHKRPSVRRHKRLIGAGVLVGVAYVLCSDSWAHALRSRSRLGPPTPSCS